MNNEQLASQLNGLEYGDEISDEESKLAKTHGLVDGFRDFFELRDWFKGTHGLPFEGVVIKWNKITNQLK